MKIDDDKEERWRIVPKTDGYDDNKEGEERWRQRRWNIITTLLFAAARPSRVDAILHFAVRLQFSLELMLYFASVLCFASLFDYRRLVWQWRRMRTWAVASISGWGRCRWWSYFIDDDIHRLLTTVTSTMIILHIGRPTSVRRPASVRFGLPDLMLCFGSAAIQRPFPSWCYASVRRPSSLLWFGLPELMLHMLRFVVYSDSWRGGTCPLL